MAETFNPIISHLCCGQGGTSTEVTKYNNATISEINVVDNGVTTKYDFGRLCNEEMYSGIHIWNQLVQNTTTHSGQENNVTFTVSNETVSVSTTAGGASGYTFRDFNPAFSMISGHKYLVYGLPNGLSTSTCYVYLLGGGVSSNQFATNSIITCTSNTSTAKFRISVESGTVITTPLVFKFQMFDLTNIYGAGNEPSTVVEFANKYSNEYYPYDPGTPFSTATELFRTIKQPVDSITFYGNTMRWCQLTENGNFANGTTGWSTSNCTATVSDGIVEITPTAADCSFYQYRTNRFVGHKYLALATIKTANTSAYLAYGSASQYDATKPNIWQQLSVLFEETSTGRSIAFRGGTSDDFSPIYAKYCMLFDLTYIFGEGNEPTADEFNGRLKKLYYPNTSGEIISIEQDTAYLYGLNLWDEEWEIGGISDTTGLNDATTDKIRSKNYARIFPNEKYYITVPTGIVLCFYDADKSFIGSTTTSDGEFTPPISSCYVRFSTSSSYGTTYNNDICINLSDSSINGAYEASKGEQVITTNTELRGVGDAVDTVTVEKETTEPFGLVDLGTLNWTYSGGIFRSNTTVENIKLPASAYVKANILCAKYETDTADHVVDRNTDKTISTAGSAGNIWIYDSSYTDTATFKTAMSGAYLYYELVDYPLNDTPILSGSYVKNVGSYTFTGQEQSYSYGTGGYYIQSSVLPSAPRLGSSNIISDFLVPVAQPVDVREVQNGICIYTNGNVYMSQPPTNLVGVTISYELATPVETTLTEQECAQVLNGAFTKSKYSTLLISNNNGQIDQTVDVGVWEQR